MGKMDGAPQLRLLVVLGSLPALLCGQRTTFGFIGGVNLTRDFPITRQTYVDPNYPQGLTAFDLYSDTRSAIAGVSAEVALVGGLSLQANALRRSMALRRRFVFPQGAIQDDGRLAVVTWQWPVLVKYSLPLKGSAKPFLEAGPSFRTRHDPVPAEPSQLGFTAGAGAEFRWGRLVLSPGWRYTRWQYDGDFPRIATKRDQVEFLTVIGCVTSVPSWKVGGKKLRFGLVGGTPFTAGLRQADNQLQGYVVGLAAEWDLRPRLSLESNALYRPLRVGGDPSLEFTVLTWQFPVLAKWRLKPGAAVQPVLEAGPSFRSSGNRNGYHPSRLGITVGGGIETFYKTLKVGPVLRYTRWSEDQGQRGSFRWFLFNRTAPNQVELLVSFTF